MKARNDCEIACDCVKRANVVLHVRLCKEIFARKHTATHKPTSAQPPHSDQRDTHTYTHINRLWSPCINRLWSPLAYGLGYNPDRGQGLGRGMIGHTRLVTIRHTRLASGMADHAPPEVWIVVSTCTTQNSFLRFVFFHDDEGKLIE